MCDSICQKEEWFKSVFGLTADGLRNRKEVSKDVIKYIIDNSFMSNIRDLAKYFGHIVKISKQLEGDSASVTQVWPSVIELYKYYEGLKSEVAPIFKRTINVLLEAINKRTKPLHNDIFLLAFFLSPMHRHICTSREYGLQSILLKLGKFSIQMKNSLDESQAVAKSAIMYSKGEGVFGEAINDPVEYWNKMPECGLKKIALRIVAIIPHSASVERLFSRLTYIKSKWQNRMTPDTLTGLAQIKMQIRSDRMPVKKAQKQGQSLNNNDIENDPQKGNKEGDRECDNDENVSFTSLNEEYDLKELGMDEEELELNSIDYFFNINLDNFKPIEIVVAPTDEVFEYTANDILKGLNI